MRQAVIADPVALGAGAFGAGAALGVGELLSDYEESRSHALGAEHVEDMVGYFGLGPIVEAERDFHFGDPLEPPAAGDAPRGAVAPLAWVACARARLFFFLLSG